jgi:ATP-dependent Lon protease
VSESFAPARANSSAHAAPIPSEAPVMSATLPSIRMRPYASRRRRLPDNSTMHPRLIPLFPLQVVVFPRTRLPLHIFEERYKEMVGEAIRDESEFGVVLAKDDGIVNAGCSVTVEKVMEMYSDGRMDILCLGKRRFEIVALNQEKSFLQGEVSFFDDEDFAPAPPTLRNEALTHYQALAALGSRRQGEPDLGDTQLSFQIAQAVPDLDFLNRLLRHRSETERLQELNRYLSEYVPRQRTIERMKVLAPTNGFGGKPAGL